MKTDLPFPRHSLLVPEAFAQAREKARAGELASHPAYQRLLADAEKSLGAATLSVTGKSPVPPSGDKRDYFSLSIYFWPNPETPDGLPYAPKDGVINPEIENYDYLRFVAMCGHVDALALAYGLGGEERYAAKAAEFLRAWFLAEETRMNPNMLFAQYIPGENIKVPWPNYPARFVPGAPGHKGIYVSFGGVIEDFHLIPLTDSIALLRGSKSWSEADDRAMSHWFRSYTQWLLTHQHGLDEAACLNNHGSWYWADILCFLDFLDEKACAAACAERAISQRLHLQIEPDGRQPEELARTLSKTYTAFTLCSFTNMAVSARRCGYDSWGLKTPDGRSIRRAVDWFLPYLTGESSWPWPQIKPYEDERMAGPLAACAAGSGDPQYREALAALPLPPDHRFRVLYDFPQG